MKNRFFSFVVLFCGSILFSGSVALAGPEDHAQNQVCYALQTSDIARLAGPAPTEFCFETVSIDVVNKVFTAFSYFEFYQSSLRNLKLTELVRQTGGNFSYRSEAVLFQTPERHCEDGVTLTLRFEGEVDSVGYGEIGAQNLSLIQESKADICHSTATTEIFKYTLWR